MRGSAAAPPKSVPPLLVGTCTVSFRLIGVKMPLLSAASRRFLNAAALVGRQVRADVVDREGVPHVRRRLGRVRLRRPALLARHLRSSAPAAPRSARSARRSRGRTRRASRSCSWRRRRRGCGRCGGWSSAAAPRWDRCPRDRDARTGSATAACRCARRAPRSTCRTGWRRCGRRRRSRRWAIRAG